MDPALTDKYIDSLTDGIEGVLTLLHKGIHDKALVVAVLESCLEGLGLLREELTNVN